ncbi:MAG TPA: carotenoid 1,2-hydratase [Steroidobacteraceae bacterium]
MRARKAALLVSPRCGWGALFLTAAAMAAEPALPSGPPPASVVPGYALEFPRDYGSHPQFGVEWWYLTGWLETGKHERLGFQVTFFRSRQAIADANPSAFAPRELLIAHCAISDPGRGRLWQDQRIRRAGLGLAQAQSDNTRVWIDDWKLELGAAGYQAHVAAQDFALELQLQITQPVLLNGVAGFSQKGPSPQSASYYYSQPQLRVSGSIARASRRDAVVGRAWLDHEWSSRYLDPAADGWDWVGLNLDDGGAVMAFRIRDHQGQTYWAGGTLRDAHGRLSVFGPDQVSFSPGRIWHSPRSGANYPVTWQLHLGARQLDIEPLLDDQENDARLSSGAIYWEGAVRVQEKAHAVGAGYLELTGYDSPLSLH